MIQRVLVLLVLALTVANSQPKQWYVVRGDSMKWNPHRAALLYFMKCEEAARETTILVYIKQGFWWTAPDEKIWSPVTCNGTDSAWITYSIDYHFTIDSIIGRGDQRKALFSWARKTCDDSGKEWVWLVERQGEWIANPSGGHSAVASWDTLGRTTDSTLKLSRWLTYSRKVLDLNGNGWYTYAGATPVEEWCDVFEGSPYRWYVWIRMEKILGDPTVNNGWNQRAVLKMKLYQGPNDSLYRAVVGDVSTW